MAIILKPPHAEEQNILLSLLDQKILTFEVMLFSLLYSTTVTRLDYLWESELYERTSMALGSTRVNFCICAGQNQSTKQFSSCFHLFIC